MRSLFVIGGTGFIGSETIRQAAAAGWEVRALARSPERAERLRALGAVPVLGDPTTPGAWSAALRGTQAVVDLSQPELPTRIRQRDIAAASRTRQSCTLALLAALSEIAAAERPVLIVPSGTDDLMPDSQGRIGDDSPLVTRLVGFAHIGVPVRRLVEASALPATFVYLGTVYGPGKSFAASVFPRLAKGRLVLPAPARNSFPLIHVRDAARALVHLAGLGTDRLAGRSWLLVDAGGGAPLGDFFDEAARLLGAAPPRRLPAWLMSKLLGQALFETMTRDLTGTPMALLATGFAFAHPTFREGLPATLAALGYDRPKAAASPRRRRVGWRSLLALCLAAVAAVNGLTFPLSVPYLRDLAGGQPILDMRPGYTPDAAHALFTALGAPGRAQYLTMLWTLDLLLPALFSALLFSAVGAGALRRWRWAALAPGALDYLENGAISALLLSYPARHPGLVALASALTLTKVALYLVAAAVALAGAGLAARSRRPQADRPTAGLDSDRGALP